MNNGLVSFPRFGVRRYTHFSLAPESAWVPMPRLFKAIAGVQALLALAGKACTPDVSLHAGASRFSTMTELNA
ncbi:MAG TPA: hypothetical protein VIF10_02185 [Methylobacter sp.]|jgi:hypothetical protein